MKIVGGSASLYLARKVSLLGSSLDFIPVETRFFPDGELYVRVHGDVSGERVVLIQSMYRTPNAHLVEFIFLYRTLLDLGASSIISFIPYLPYARQDARFKPGEAISFEILLEVFESMGIDRIRVFDLHLHRAGDLERLGRRIKVENLTTMYQIAEYLDEFFRLGENTIVVGPDEESYQWASKVAEKLGFEFFVLEKTRLGPEYVEINMATEEDVRGKLVILVDDIISTGSTIASSARLLWSKGARDIIVACAHPVLAGSALFKIYNAGIRHLVSTDTIPSPVSFISVAPAIFDVIRRL